MLVGRIVRLARKDEASFRLMLALKPRFKTPTTRTSPSSSRVRCSGLCSAGLQPGTVCFNDADPAPAGSALHRVPDELGLGLRTDKQPPAPMPGGDGTCTRKKCLIHLTCRTCLKKSVSFVSTVSFQPAIV
jgi:hypothetical protein